MPQGPQVGIRWAALPMGAAGVAATVALFVTGKNELAFPSMSSASVYGGAQVVLVLMLMCSAVLLLLVKEPVTRTVALASGGMASGQLVGVGLVATRRWPHLGGASGLFHEWDRVVALAWVMVVVSVVAALACTASLWRLGALRGSKPWLSVVCLLVGVAVAVLTPRLMDPPGGGGRDGLALALIYSFPWAVALALCGLLAYVAGAAVAAVVAASTGVAATSESMVSRPATAGVVVATASALAVAVLCMALHRAERKRSTASSAAPQII